MVQRVAAILRLVAAEPTGVTTIAVAERSGLTRPTAHRLLLSLAAEGLVDRGMDGRRWILGPEAFLLGTIAHERSEVEDRARPALIRIAQETGESAFLSVRRGFETVCLLREEGSFPVRSFVLHVGARFPLGTGSAGVAILAFLPPDDQREALEATRNARAALGPLHTDGEVLELVEATRRNGWSVNPGRVVEGSWGMGAAVFDARQRPVWALSVTGIELRFRDSRQRLVGRLLLEEAHRVSQTLRSGV